jgi:hypothetical protein
MRLSCTPISLLRFSLIAFLTLLKPDARAQSMLAANSVHYSSHNRSSVEIAGREPIESETNTDKCGGVADSRSSTVNFINSTVPVSPAPNSCRIFTGCQPLRVRIYSASIQHSMRITIKLFKVVVVPLWYSK